MYDLYHDPLLKRTNHQTLWSRSSLPVIWPTSNIGLSWQVSGSRPEMWCYVEEEDRQEGKSASDDSKNNTFAIDELIV